MSDDEDLGSVEDFSASEDEWKPGKVHRQDTDESDDDDSDFEDDAATKKRDGKSQVKTAIKSDRAVKQTKKRKPNGSSLRTKLYNKYKPPPKTIRNQSTTPSRSIRQNQSRSTAQTAKGASPDGRKVEASDSDSSGDDYLVNPNEIDLKSSFFDVKPSTSGEIVERNAPPQFDCNAGMQLTDSEDNDGNDHDDDDDDDDNDDDTDSIGGAAKQSGNKEKPVDLGYLQNYAANMKKAEVLYKKQKELSLVAADAKVDVSSLLAMGESTSANSKAPIKSTKSVKRLTKKTQSSQSANAAAVAADTDSDWEEVEDENHIIAETQTANTLANGIQVCIDLPQNRRKDKKAIDAEASLKRQLNRIIKENQIFLHKVGLLCHIHHGLFINKAANNIHLMPIALKLLPSKNVYPSGQTEIKYFQSMVTWYKTTIKLVDNRMYPKIRIDPVISLAVQLKNRHAVCKRDFVLMFVILLRAMGMQCRLVVNMVPAPLRPPQSALCSLKMKPVDDGKDKDSATVKKERFRYPSLSPEEKEELKKNFEMLEEDIKKRKKEKLKCQPSFEEDLEVKSPPLIPPKAAQKSAEKSEQMIPKKEDLKRKSLDTLDEPETKKSAKNDSTKSPYFADSDKTTTQKPKLESNKKRKPKSETEEDPEYIPYSKKVADAKIKQEQEKLSAYLDSKPSITVIPKSKEQPLKGRKTRTKNAITTKAPKPNQQQKLIPDNMQNLENIPNESDAKIKLEQEKLAAILNIKPNVSLPRIPKSKAKSSKGNTPNQIENTSNLARLHQIEKILPEVVINADKKQNLENIPNSRATRSRSKSPKVYVSPSFLHSETNKVNQATDNQTQLKRKTSPNPSTSTKSYISSEFLKKKSKTTSIDVKVGQPSPRKLRSKTKLTVPQLDGADDVPKVRRKPKPVNNSDDDFQPVAPKNAVKKQKKIDRQVLSPDVSEKNQSLGVIKKDTINMWIEVYSELEAQWVCVDLFKGKVNCLDTIRKSVAPSTLAYVFAYNSDGTLKDVTPRYCVQWAAVVRKGRVEQSWLDEAIEQYIKTHRTQMDINEDNDLRKIHLDKPLPTTISEYKDHPLYALERHLLKFQAIYPPNALTLGFVRGEAVYARECVHTLHSRDIWLKSARVVKIGEKPYKVVKARPKWDKLNNTVIKDLPLEIFGYWQTQEYEPPTAENGIVPRNAYGNVELFKECMLPKKTVHLNLPGLNKVCKKLGIDCASAVIGFDFHQGACHPLYDGFVVCEEFADVVVDAWNREQEEAERKEQEKYETRVYGNWKKLIKGLLIRERLKLKYNF